MYGIWGLIFLPLPIKQLQKASGKPGSCLATVSGKVAKCNSKKTGQHQRGCNWQTIKHQSHHFRCESSCWGHKYLDVSENSGFSPQIINFNRVFHYKPSILGYPYFGSTHMFFFVFLNFWLDVFYFHGVASKKHAIHRFPVYDLNLNEFKQLVRFDHPSTVQHENRSWK